MLPRAESFLEFLDVHLTLEVATIHETLLPRAESFLEFKDMTSASFEPHPDLMRRPAMERIHTDPRPDLMLSNEEFHEASTSLLRSCTHFPE